MNNLEYLKIQRSKLNKACLVIFALTLMISGCGGGEDQVANKSEDVVSGAIPLPLYPASSQSGGALAVPHPPPT